MQKYLKPTLEGGLGLNSDRKRCGEHLLVPTFAQSPGLPLRLDPGGPDIGTEVAVTSR